MEKKYYYLKDGDIIKEGDEQDNRCDTWTPRLANIGHPFKSNWCGTRRLIKIKYKKFDSDLPPVWE